MPVKALVFLKDISHQGGKLLCLQRCRLRHLFGLPVDVMNSGTRIVLPGVPVIIPVDSTFFCASHEGWADRPEGSADNPSIFIKIVDKYPKLR